MIDTRYNKEIKEKPGRFEDSLIPYPYGWTKLGRERRRLKTGTVPHVLYADTEKTNVRWSEQI